MRAGVFSLAQSVAAELGRDPADGSLYVFVSRDCKKAKMLRFETSGWCLWYVRLVSGSFRWTFRPDGTPCLSVERRQLLWLLEGLPIEQPSAPAVVTATRVI